jgi:xanthine/uracil/vitamin C permease (AzgA family)
MAHIDNYFHVTDRGSSILIEFTGGMTTFLSMSYIMILNGKKINLVCIAMIFRHKKFARGNTDTATLNI